MSVLVDQNLQYAVSRIQYARLRQQWLQGNCISADGKNDSLNAECVYELTRGPELTVK